MVSEVSCDKVGGGRLIGRVDIVGPAVHGTTGIMKSALHSR